MIWSISVLRRRGITINVIMAVSYWGLIMMVVLVSMVVNVVLLVMVMMIVRLKKLDLVKITEVDVRLAEMNCHIDYVLI